MKYITENTCCKEIDFQLENGKVTDVNFVKGCPGNLLGMKSFVVGMDVDDVIQKLDGIDCNGKGTSCPDQFAKALKQYKNTVN